MKQLTQYHWYHHRNCHLALIRATVINILHFKLVQNSFCEWNGTRPFRTCCDPFDTKKFSNLSPEILVEWIAPLVYRVLFWYMTSLWSIDTRQIKLFANQYHVTISWAQVIAHCAPVLLKLTADQVLVFDWIMASCQVSLLKTEPGCSEAC